MSLVQAPSTHDILLRFCYLPQWVHDPMLDTWQSHMIFFLPPSFIYFFLCTYFYHLAPSLILCWLHLGIDNKAYGVVTCLCEAKNSSFLKMRHWLFTTHHMSVLHHPTLLHIHTHTHPQKWYENLHLPLHMYTSFFCNKPVPCSVILLFYSGLVFRYHSQTNRYKL